jgi:exosortase
MGARPSRGRYAPAGRAGREEKGVMTSQLQSLGRRIGLVRWVLVVGCGASLLWAYWPKFGELAERWSHDSQYSHGYLVPLLAGGILFCRRKRWPGGRAGVSWWGVSLLGVAALPRLAGSYYHVTWLEAISLLPALAGLCVLFGGWQLLRWALPAIAFLAFMVPLPYQAEVALAHPLQRLATVAGTYALETLGFPAVAEGNIIRLDDVSIGVVEACSGLSMLLVFLALATAVALLSRRPLAERLAVVASAVPIAVVANVVRITVTAVLHETVGSEWVNLVFHDLAGWLMMPLALALLLAELWLLRRLVREEAMPVAGPLRLTAAGR